MSPADRRRVRALREHAKQLRHLADEITSEANALEAELSTSPLIGGRALVDAAVSVLSDTPGHTLHYRDLLAAVEARSGMEVRGDDPAATFLANLHRDPRVRSCGDRSGRYVLANHAYSDGALAHNLAQGDPAQAQGNRLRATGSRSVPPV